MRSSKQVWAICAVLALGAPGCNQSQENKVSEDAYNESVRCYQAASAYGQILGLLGKTDEQKGRMLDYGQELRERAVQDGAKIKKTEADVLGAMSPDYLNKFLVLDDQRQAAALTDFGKAEVEHCKLDAVIAG